MSKHKTSYGLLIFLCVIPFLLVHFQTLEDGHDWGGDFAQYIRHAKNLVEHKAYDADVLVEDRVIYPPGFPLIISPLVKIFGINFWILKIPNIFFWLGFCFAVYYLFKKRLNKDHALLAFLVLLSSSEFFVLKQSIISDVPFLFFLTLSLVTFTKFCELKPDESSERTIYGGLSVVLMNYAFFIRWAGLSLILCAILYLLMIRKNYKYIGLLSGVTALMMWIQLSMGVVGSGYLDELPASHTLYSIFEFNYAGQMINRMIAFYISFKTMFSIPVYALLQPTVKFLSPILLLVMILWAFYRIYKRKISFIGLFFIVYFVALMF